VRAVSSTKGVVYVDVAMLGKFLSKSNVTFFFFLVETQVLENKNFAGLQRG